MSERQQVFSEGKDVTQEVDRIEQALQRATQQYHGDAIERAWCESVATKLYALGVRFPDLSRGAGETPQ